MTTNIEEHIEYGEWESPFDDTQIVGDNGEIVATSRLVGGFPAHSSADRYITNMEDVSTDAVKLNGHGFEAPLSLASSLGCFRPPEEDLGQTDFVTVTDKIYKTETEFRRGVPLADGRQLAAGCLRRIQSGYTPCQFILIPSAAYLESGFEPGLRDGIHNMVAEVGLNKIEIQTINVWEMTGGNGCFSQGAMLLCIARHTLLQNPS